MTDGDDSSGLVDRARAAPALTAAGTILIALALAADVLGLGGRPGFGMGQALLLVLGLALAAGGFALGSRGLRRRLEPGVTVLTRLYRWAAFSCFNLVLVIAGLELWGVWIDRYDPLPAPETRAPYYASEPWAETYWRELEQVRLGFRYRPFAVWQTPAYQGQTIQVDQRGVRRTPGASPAADAFTVAAFGGSAMWGHGAADHETIPAHLQIGLSEAMDRPVRVENFGERGYVATQSLIRLIAELQAGRVPDLVIFYHGFNDVAVARSGKVDGHYEEARIAGRLERPLATWLGTSRALSLLHGLVPAGPAYLSEASAEERDRLYRALVGHYLGTYRVLEALAREYGFRVHCFWQPVLTLTGKSLSPREEALRAEDPRWLVDLLRAVYREIGDVAERHEHVHSLVDVLDGETEQVFIDMVHVTPAGNRIIAGAILDVIFGGSGGGFPDRQS